MLPSLRHYLRFIEADKKLDAHGFIRKVRSRGLLKLYIVNY